MSVESTTPLFSIISVVKNATSREAMFRRSIESVLGQTYADLELVIQDGGSADGTAKIVAAYQDPRIQFLSEPDACPEEGFFRALKRCRGTYIGLCLSDEQLLDDALAHARRVFEEYPDIAAFYGNVCYVNEKGETWGPRVPPHPFRIEAYVCQSLVPPFCSAFFRRGAVEQAGLHTHSWRDHLGEFEFWIRLADVGEIIYQPCNISYFGRHAQSNTCTVKLYDQMVAEREKAMADLFRENRILRDCNVTVEQAIAGNYVWGASGIFGIEGYSEKCKYFMQQAERYAPKSLQLARLRSKLGECHSVDGTSAESHDEPSLAKPRPAVLPASLDELKKLILCECPGLDEALRHNEIHSSVEMLRDWTSRNVAVCDDVKKSKPQDTLSVYHTFSERRGGTWCYGTAVFHAQILNLFGIPAVRLSYGHTNGSVLSYTVTVFADPTSSAPRFYVSDAYFNLDYRDAASGNPLELTELLRRIGRHEYESILVRERPAVRPCVVQVGADPSSYWFYPNGNAGTPQRLSDRWVYPETDITVASLINLEPAWRREIEEKRGDLEPSEFLFQLMLLNQRFDGFASRALTEQLIGQLNCCPKTAPPRARRSTGISGEVARSPMHGEPKSARQEATFAKWIGTLASLDNRLYYRDQSPQTLAALSALACDFDPSVIVELGTLGGLSLRTWLAASERARVIAVDLSFARLAQTRRVLPLDLSRVTLLEQDILKTDFASLWTPRDRVILFVDAHDLPQVPIMRYVLATALPALPDGSLVVVDDVWFSEQRLTRDNARAFLDDHVVAEIDELQCFNGHFAPYHASGSFMGFAEVIPLLDFINEHGIELAHEQGGKHVWFTWKKDYLLRRRGAGEMSDAYRGAVMHNPLESVPVSELLRETMHGLASAYPQGKTKQIAESLRQLVIQHPHDQGFRYALAVCLARLGMLPQARDILVGGSGDSQHPRYRRLLDDLTRCISPSPALQAAKPQSQTDETSMTVFALPKPFAGDIGIIQRNAIRSWARLRPAPEIILFGDESGTREMAAEVGARHIPEIARNEYGTPLVNKLFEAAQDQAHHPIIAYVNADMILFQDFVDAAQKVQAELPNFLLIGQRWDLPFFDEIDFGRADWQQMLQRQMAADAMIHPESGLDYFVFRKGLWPNIPAFAIGRTVWDSWLVADPNRRGVPVVDGTDAITAVHQDHDYGHMAGGRQEAWHGAEAARNRESAGPTDGSGRTSGATWRLNKDGTLVETLPREPWCSTAAYKDERSTWLLRQADNLVAIGKKELAACKCEEALVILRHLLLLKQKNLPQLKSLDATALAQRYVSCHTLLAQCYQKMARYDQVTTVYTELLENSYVQIPPAVRDNITRLRDQAARLSPACPSAAAGKNVATRANTPQIGAPATAPKVSIVLACYNAQQYLSECLDSILSQTLHDWELHILDDGSADNTRRIIEDYAGRDSRIIPHCFSDNAGPYVRRNYAIERARAPFIVIQDADDLMCPDKLERLHHAITADERLGVVGSFYRMFLDEYQGPDHAEDVMLRTEHEQILEDYRNCAICDYSWHGSAIIRKRLFEEIGPYDENPFSSDSFWLAKVAEYACRCDDIRLKNISDVLTLRRMRADSQTSSLPSFDPRGRRAMFRDYRRSRLSEVTAKLDASPGADVKAELRRSVCNDFVQTHGHLFEAWDARPLTSEIANDFIARIFNQFARGQFVRCIVTCGIVERLAQGIAQAVRRYDLVRGLAYFALGLPEQSRIYLEREFQAHGTAIATEFRKRCLERYDAQWTRTERAAVVRDLVLRAKDSSRSTQTHASSVRCVVEGRTDRAVELSIIVSDVDDATLWARRAAALAAQSEKGFELIVLNRGNDTGQYVSLMQAGGFDFVVLEVADGIGPWQSMNIAVERARGPYVVLLGEWLLPEPDFARRALRQLRSGEINGLRGRIVSDSTAIPACFDLGSQPLYAACDTDLLCVFRKDVFLALGGFAEMPFDRGAIQLSYRIYTDRQISARPILYCPEVVARYVGPSLPRESLIDRFALENHFCIEHLRQTGYLHDGDDYDVLAFLRFVEGLYALSERTDEDRYRRSLDNSLFFERRFPRVAADWAQAALSYRPDSLKARYVAGSSYAGLSQPQRAVTFFEEMLAPLEELLALGRLDRARSEFRDYTQLGECYAASCTLLAQCYIKLGRQDDVVAVYTRLLENRHVQIPQTQRDDMERLCNRLRGSARETPAPVSSSPASAPTDARPKPVSEQRSNPDVVDAQEGRVTPRSERAVTANVAEPVDAPTATLAGLEAKYLSMPLNAPTKHVTAWRLSELCRRVGQKEKADAYVLQALKIKNVAALDEAKQHKPSFCKHKPMIVEFNVITRCNAGCIMCNYGPQGDILELERFKRLADDLLPTARKAMLIGGEVLLHPDFYEMCEYAGRFGVSLGMTTNLCSLGGRRAEAIQRFFRSVKVSVDAATKRTYESIRTHLSFDRLQENLQILARIKQQRPDLKLELACVAMRQNIAELPDTIEMVGRLGFDSVAVSFVQVRGELAIDDSLLFHRELANRYFDLARQKAQVWGLRLDIPENFDVSREPFFAAEVATEGHKQCLRPWERVRVYTNGDIIPCCHLHSQPMGNVFEDRFERIWNGPRYADLREAIANGGARLPDRCKHCQILLKRTDSNDAMLHVSPERLDDMKQCLGVAGPAALPTSVAGEPADVPHPKVTVVTACHNCERFLAESLESVRRQSLPEWELFLLDDGSTDGTRRIIEEYARRDPRIKPFHFDTNAGPYVRRNFAIERAGSEFIVIHDSDDLMLPTKLEMLYNEISRDSRLAMVGSFYRTFFEVFKDIRHTDPIELPLEHAKIAEQAAAWQHGISHISAIIRKSMFERIGGYDENPFASDAFWSAKLAEYSRHDSAARFKNISEYLTLYRVHGVSQTQVLSTFDPRNRRVRYRNYCECKLDRIREKLRTIRGTDVARELRECKCSDFLTRFKAHIVKWENEPLAPRVLTHLLQGAVGAFNGGYYVSCVNLLNGVQAMDPTISRRVVGFNLLRGLGFFALDVCERSLACLEQEIESHDNPAARKFVVDAFEEKSVFDVSHWCHENAGPYNLGLQAVEAETSVSAGAEVKQNGAL